MTEPSLPERIAAILLIEDIGERNRELNAMAALQDGKSMEAFDAIIPFLTHSDENLCRRAGSALGRFPRQVEQRADVVIEHLLHNPNPGVRHSCAIILMKVPAASVTAAYRCALADHSDKVVQLACWELGFRGGPESAEALFSILGHPSWRVRLEVCKALITQGRTDQRVVETIKAMSREPEADVYDAECDDLARIIQETVKETGEIPPDKMWGKLNTILAGPQPLQEGQGRGWS